MRQTEFKSTSAFTAATQLRGHLLCGLAVTVALVGVWQQYANARSEAVQSRERTMSCRQLASELMAMRDRPTFVASEICDVTALTGMIGGARIKAGLEENRIDLVDPRQAERLRDSPYLVRPVSIALRGLTLRQAATFIHSLSDPNQGMWVSQMRLSPTRHEAAPAAAELWNTELLLTQLVFSPIVKIPSSRPVN